jgi:hypothetical protein
MTLTIKDIMRIAKISESTARRWVKGRLPDTPPLPARRIGRQWRVRESELLEHLNSVKTEDVYGAPPDDHDLVAGLTKLPATSASYEMPANRERPIKPCTKCGESRQIYALGLCNKCYKQQRTRKKDRMPHQLTRQKQRTLHTTILNAADELGFGPTDMEALLTLLERYTVAVQDTLPPEGAPAEGGRAPAPIDDAEDDLTPQTRH